MEEVKKISRFLSVCSGYGSGDGSGSGYGYGDGYGDGSGYGYGDGYGDGSGSGYGSGYGYGDGDGDGSGYGYGYGSGYGYGYGSGYSSGYDLKTFNNELVYYVDKIPCIFEKIVNNLAKVIIVNKDLTTEKAFICKDESRGLFAHGATFREAKEALEAKVMDSLSDEEKIEKFFDHFNKKEKYKGREFYEWHHILTGSCEFGRNKFVSDHGLSLDDEFTVREFFDLCKDDYGGSIIRDMMERINED